MTKVLLGDVRGLLDEQKYERHLREIHPRRRDRIKKMKSQMDRCRMLAAGLLLKEEIIFYGLNYEELDVETGTYGKPFLTQKDRTEHPAPDPGDFCYSVSHAGDYAALAVDRGAVGIDIEQEGRIRRGDSFARRVLTDEEFSRMDPENDPGFQREMTRLWTRKEAVVKAESVGLSRDFRQVPVLDRWAEAHIFSMEPVPGLWLSICRMDGAWEQSPKLHWRRW